MAEHINASPRFGGHGPYRFNASRADFRFYLQNNVAYYRLVDMVVPQALSHWYLGAGGTVGFHTITGMAALHDLIERRACGEIDFQVWPQEGEQPDGGKHLLVESYPAIYPKLDDYGPCHDDHQKDAWKVLQWLLKADAAGSLGRAFAIALQPFGRYEGASFLEQIRFEGWIVGVAEQ